MAVLTPLALSDAIQIGALYGLNVAGLQGIQAGSVNSNYALVLQDGLKVFLRIYEEQSMPTAKREASMLAYLAGRGVKTPRPLYRVDIAQETLCAYAGKPVSLFPWIEGEARCQAQVSDEHLFEVGRQLALLHRAGEAFQDAAPNRFSKDALVRRLDALDPALSEGLKPDVKDAALYLKTRLLAYSEPPGRACIGVIHGDVFRDNVLWQGDSVAALLDFESASRGTAAFDLGVTLLAWCYQDSLHEGFCLSMAKGYVSVRPLLPLEIDILWDETRFAAMRFATTRITDFELRPWLGSYRDFRRYLRRLAALDTMGKDRFLALLGLR